VKAADPTDTPALLAALDMMRHAPEGTTGMAGDRALVYLSGLPEMTPMSIDRGSTRQM